MAGLTPYHLAPRGPFHLGRRGVELEATDIYIPSDTLFAAILAARAETGHNPQDIADLFPRDGHPPEADRAPFLLTSAFPRAGQVRFYPMPPLTVLPVSDGKLAEMVEAGYRKDLNTIRFMSEGLFKQFIAGQWLDDWIPPADENDIEATDKGLYLQGKRLWLTAEEVDQLPEFMHLSALKLPEATTALEREAQTRRHYRALRSLAVWGVHKAPRVTVDRSSNASAIYYAGRQIFNPNCGFWFGIDWRNGQARLEEANQTVAEAISQALTLLQDNGLGGERSVGYGQFECHEGAGTLFDDPPDEEAQRFITLSRYHPCQRDHILDQLQQAGVAYNLVSVGGWLQSIQRSALRRRRVWLISEGSVLPHGSGSLLGDLIDVQPTLEAAAGGFPHPIWRYGLAYPVAVKEPSHEL